MSWAAILSILVTFFKDVLPFLQDLFDKAKLDGDPEKLSPEGAVVAAFDAAIAVQQKNWKPWQWFRVARLKAGKRIALREAGQLVGAARGTSTPPKLTPWDRDAIENA